MNGMSKMKGRMNEMSYMKGMNEMSKIRGVKSIKGAMTSLKRLLYTYLYNQFHISYNKKRSSLFFIMEY